MTTPAIDDCFLHDKDRLPHGEAVEILATRVLPNTPVERVSLERANARIVASAVRAPHDVPAHRNAAVDGYAFSFSAYDATTGTTFPLSGRISAGHPMTDTFAPASAVRIFTGAPVPEGADTVVMQEDVQLVDTTSDGVNTVHVVVPGGLKNAANVRASGEDLGAGDMIVDAGHRLRPQDLAALASAGREDVRCFRPPRVGVFSSGDEVIRPGAPLAFGQVYDANAAMLPSLITAAGATFEDLGVLPDNSAAVRACLSEAATRFDLLITSGGASLGEEDHIASVLDEIGTRHLWQIAIKPGRPMMFGQIGKTVFMGLPGNPVAVFVCFALYGRPLLTRLGGGQWDEPQRYRVPAAFSIARKKPDRREFLRGRTSRGPEGPVLSKFPRDGSGLITSLREANGFIEIPEDVTSVAEGDLLDFIPFTAFGII